jgi:hypothetical protein
MQCSSHAIRDTLDAALRGLAAYSSLEASPSPLYPYRDGIIGLFLAVTQFYIDAPAEVHMDQEVRELLMTMLDAAHCEEKNARKEALMIAVRVVGQLPVIGVDPGVEKALRQARVALISQKDTVRLVAAQ